MQSNGSKIIKTSYTLAGIRTHDLLFLSNSTIHKYVCKAMQSKGIKVRKVLTFFTLAGIRTHDLLFLWWRRCNYARGRQRPPEAGFE
jgi:hypothetical protein